MDNMPVVINIPNLSTGNLIAPLEGVRAQSLTCFTNAVVSAYPVLKSFYVNVIDDKSISVNWEAWSPERGDKGVGEPNGYIVRFKERAANSWNQTDIIPDPENGTLLADITDLKANTEYRVQVLVHDVSGHVHSQTAPTATVRTQCGAPLSSPINFSHKEMTDGMVNVTWQLPERSQWQCAAVSVKAQINDGDPQLSNKTGFIFQTTPFTTYHIQARLETSRGVGPWSDPYEFTTPEEAPGEMSSPYNERLSAKTYKLRWQPPAVANGILRRYDLLLNVDGLRGVQCPEFQAPDGINVSFPANVTSAVFENLTASARYSLRIRATTVKDGPWKYDELSTLEEVPEATPQGLKVTKVTGRSAVVSWQPPDCTKVNGQVTAYHLNRNSMAKWASNEFSTTQLENGLEMDDLVPFTKYKITVSAENSAGVGPSAAFSFRTAPSAPPAPTNLTVYSASSEHLAFSWLPPYPPYGLLESYTVLYKPAQESRFRYTPELLAEQATCDGDAEARSGHHCAIIAPLVPNMEYHVVVTLNNLLSSEHNVSMDVSAEERQAQFRNLTPGTPYVARVEARTSVGYGETVEIPVHTRPSLPVIGTKVELKDVDDNSITLQLKRPDRYYYVVVQRHDQKINRSRRSTDRSEKNAGGPREWTEGTPDYNESVAMNLSYYMAAKMSPEEVTKRGDFTVGDGLYYGGYYNAPLVPESTYSVGLAAEVDFEGDRRISYTLLSEPVTAASLSIVDDNDGLEFEMEEMGGTDTDIRSKPLPVSDLQDYVQRMLACDGLKSEFINQPKGRQFPTIEAQRIENKIKNRYGNLLAYDYTRVKLRSIPGVPFSDYINANYIDAPSRSQYKTFWRMVWQENVCKIVMLTGLVENGKTKCEKYWPDKTATYGDVQVHFIAEETFPEYCVRQLHMTMADNTREVKHFHLTSWPDHGVPLYPNTLLTFRRKVNQYRTFNEAPVVVHCSAGVGRTGAYILLENLIEQAQAEGVVDVVGQLSLMRQSRMNVVETLNHRQVLKPKIVRRDERSWSTSCGDKPVELGSVLKNGMCSRNGVWSCILPMALEANLEGPGERARLSSEPRGSSSSFRRIVWRRGCCYACESTANVRASEKGNLCQGQPA
ncbi:hypothetical protein HPB51_003190 [Rhipicephalus microplus]|uniref:Protein-tyrosine-phosphatase n=1 Tax=Rhipicephalus microplus TaxID=6941 RepID=A0A9J6EKU2_RHIMP|nr:hypothetical protein HPB51_003190 [Rhipicephalus microplus]